MAQGRKRLVVIDPHGKTHNPTRHLKGIAKAGEFQKRMAGLDREKLLTVEDITEKRRAKAEQQKQRVKEFEERAAEVISKTTSEHYDQLSKLLTRHHRTMETKRVELEDYYQLDQKQAYIDDLNHQLKHPNIIQKLGFKLFKTDRKLQDSISQLEATKANAKQRLSEAITQLEANRDREFHGLKKRQAEELETITNNLERWKPRERTLSQEWSRAARLRHRTRDREYDNSPSFDR